MNTVFDEFQSDGKYQFLPTLRILNKELYAHVEFMYRSFRHGDTSNFYNWYVYMQSAQWTFRFQYATVNNISFLARRFSVTDHNYRVIRHCAERNQFEVFKYIDSRFNIPRDFREYAMRCFTFAVNIPAIDYMLRDFPINHALFITGCVNNNKMDKIHNYGLTYTDIYLIINNNILLNIDYDKIPDIYKTELIVRKLMVESRDHTRILDLMKNQRVFSFNFFVDTIKSVRYWKDVLKSHTITSSAMRKKYVPRYKTPSYLKHKPIQMSMYSRLLQTKTMSELLMIIGKFANISRFGVSEYHSMIYLDLNFC